VSIFSLLNCSATTVDSVKELVSDTLRKATLGTAISSLFQPTKGERLTTLATNLSRDLVVSSTNSARTNLNHWLDVAKSLVEGLNSVSAGLLRDYIESSVKSSLSYTLFSAVHDDVDGLANNNITVAWIWENNSLKIALLS
jgi:hypothetical protein